MNSIPAPPNAIGLALMSAHEDEDGLEIVLRQFLNRVLEIEGLYGMDFMRQPYADRIRLVSMVFDLVHTNGMLLEILADDRGITPDELAAKILDARGGKAKDPE